MADDVNILDAADVLKTVATDEIAGGRHVEYVKIMDGTDASGAVIAGGATYGLKVDVTRSESAASLSFYAIKYVVGTTSVNFPFGFLSGFVEVECASSNSDDIAIDWLGATAVAPSANVAGDDLLQAGQARFLPKWATTSISCIAVSSTQTVSVRAWR
jgi:hypothetical protein